MPDFGSLSETLERLLEPAVAAEGCEVVTLELKGSPRQRLLRITIDSPAGVNVEDCGRVSRAISAVLDVEDPIEGPFTLEVSSPGVERPLRKRDDFSRFAGREVAVHHRLEGRRAKTTGRLLGIDGSDQILIEDGTGVVRVAFESVEKAHLVFHFGAQGGPARGR